MDSLQIQRLQQENTALKRIETGAIWYKTFLNRVWDKSEMCKQIQYREETIHEKLHPQQRNKYEKYISRQ